jgi:hypothetical protein
MGNWGYSSTMEVTGQLHAPTSGDMDYSSALTVITVSTLKIIFNFYFSSNNDLIYEECRLLECIAVWILSESTFRENLSPPSSG